MKKTIFVQLFRCVVAVTSLCTAFSVLADDSFDFDDGDVLEKSLLNPDRVVIRDKNRKLKGYLEPSPLNSDKTILFDSDGNSMGYFQEDFLDDNKMRFHEYRHGYGYGEDGYLKNSPLNSEHEIWFDKNGMEKGYFKRDVLNDRRRRFYRK